MHAIRSETWDGSRLGTSLVFSISFITTGFITSPSTLFSYDPPNDLIAIFPLVLIPIYLVPLSLLLHLASLAKLHGWLANRSKIATASAGLPRA